MKIRVKKRTATKGKHLDGVSKSPDLLASATEEKKYSGELDKPLSPAFEAGVYKELFLDLYDAVLMVDESGEILDANRRGEHFFAFSRDELRGKNIADLVVGMSRGMLEKVAANISQGRYTVLNANCVRKNKDTFAAEIALSRLNLDGRSGLVFSVRNESRRDGIRSRLRTEHNALQNAASAIVIADRQGGIEFVNKAFMDLWGFNEHSSQDFVLEDLWMDVDQAAELIDAPRSNRNWGGELLAVKGDGTPFWIQATSAPNRDETGHVVGAVYSFIDISERYQAEESIRKEVAGQIDQARVKDEFSGLLNIIQLEDLFQLIDSTGKSGRLTIMAENWDVVGEVRFSNGRIVSAVAGELTDKEAIIDILRTGGESFEFKRGDAGQYPETMQTSTMGILLEASRVLDEER